MSYQEFPAFIPFGEDHLFAIVCVPEGIAEQDVGAVLLTGGNYTRSHRNRMWVRTARELAARGIPSIRLDYHGIGDSTGTAHFELEVPFDADVICAARFLQRATGVTTLSLAATCFGGRGAIAAAAQLPDAVSVTIFPVPLLIPRGGKSIAVHSRLKRQLKKFASNTGILKLPWAARMRGRIARKRSQVVGPGADSAEIVSPRFKRDLLAFSQRGDVRFVFGESSPSLAGLRRCLAELDGRMTDEQRERITVDLVPGTDLARFQSLADQDIVVERTAAAVEVTTRSLARKRS